MSVQPRWSSTALVLLALGLASACSSASAPTSAQPSSAAPSVSAPSPTGSPCGTSPQATKSASAAAARPSKLLVVVIENHNVCQAAKGMPSLADIAARYGQAAQSFALVHPSLGNYLAIAGGSTFGVHDDNPPADHLLPGESVFGQVLAAGKVAKTYAEGMQGTCRTDSTGRYVAKHNPWTYFTAPAERAACQRYDVPSGTPSQGILRDDISAGALPTFSLLIPDMCDDAHDCPLGIADNWLQGWLKVLLAGPDFRAGRLAVVVTFDEDDRHANNQIFTAVLHPALQGVVVTTRLDHRALSAAASRLVGAAPLRDAAQAPDLLSVFGLAPPP